MVLDKLKELANNWVTLQTTKKLTRGVRRKKWRTERAFIEKSKYRAYCHTPLVGGGIFE